MPTKTRSAQLVPAVDRAFRDCAIERHGDEWRLEINPRQKRLTVAEYKQFKQVVHGMNGEWVRAKDAHVFLHDPSAEISQMLDSGEIPQYVFNPHSFFPTPESEVAAMVEQIADITAHEEGLVLEPSAGDGRVIRAIRRVNKKLEIHYCEIDDRRLEILGANHPDATCVGSDFLAYKPGRIYRYIIMNPPFDKRVYQTHIRHAASLLVPGGKLVTVLPKGFLHDRAFRDWAFNGYSRWHSMEASFEDTDTQCVILERDANPPSPIKPPSGYSSWMQYAIIIELDSDYRFHQAFQKITGDGDAFRQDLKRLVENTVDRLNQNGSALSLDERTIEQVINHYAEEVEGVPIVETPNQPLLPIAA